MLSIRPKVAQHALFVLARSIHPELLFVHQSRSFERNKYRVKVDITSDGHAITFASGSVIMTEVVCSAQQLLPQKRRLIVEEFRNKNARVSETRHCVQYKSEYGLQSVQAEVFWMIQNQLSNESREHDLLQKFGPSGRCPMGAISFLHIQQRERQFQIQAIHTFPDDYLILKSSSNFSVIEVETPVSEFIEGSVPRS